MGSLGKITSVKDLPADKKLLGYIRQAAKSDRRGAGRQPDCGGTAGGEGAQGSGGGSGGVYGGAAEEPKAAAAYAAFSPSCKREYAEWIAEAKRPETRERRIAQAVEWIAEGKQRNWKYQEC